MLPSREIFDLNLPRRQALPIVLDSPHSGTHFPPAYAPDYDISDLAPWVDVWVDELWQSAPDLGIPMLKSHIHRCFVDLNRHVYDVNPDLLESTGIVLEPKERTLMNGNGLLKSVGPSRQPVFEKPLTETELYYLLASYYHTYHGALTDLIAQTLSRFGRCYHLNCHAMMAKSHITGEERPDIVLSDQHGKTASSKVTKALAKIFADHGFSYQLNDPFLGGEIVQRFGKPSSHIHSVQIEINKGLYTDNKANPSRTDGFEPLQAKLRQVLNDFSDWVKQQA